MNPRPLYLILSAVMQLANATMFTTYAVYYVNQVGMNPLQLVLVGTVLEATILLLEVPTGVVADTYSRRLSVILGIFILGLIWLIEGSLPLFWAIIAAEIIRGLGETFLSGALDAWLADEVGEGEVGAIYLRSGQIGRVMGLIGAGLGVGLASIALNLPMLIGGGLYLALGVLLTAAMPEHGFTPAPHGERSPFPAMRATLQAGSAVVRRSQTLMLLLVVGIFAGVASEGFDRLWEAHLLRNFRFPAFGGFEAVVWFGIISVSSNLVTLVVTEIFRRRLERASRVPTATARLLLTLNALSVLSIIGFGLAGNFALALLALLAKAIVGSLAAPLYRAWLVQNIDSSVRATALSMISLTDALGQTIGGPGVGALGLRSLRAAIVAAGVLLAPQIALYARVIRGARATTGGELSTTAAE
jgi:DHA3 family tetracycline resistance protein-like MFS transporter